MRLRLLRLLVVAIALVVPLQGMTAVMAGQCMALGHHDGHAAPAPHDHESHDHAAHSHGDPAAEPSAHDEDSGNGPHCGPCTACCASASIAAHTALAGAAEHLSAPYEFFHLAPPGIQPERLDRPPLAL